MLRFATSRFGALRVWHAVDECRMQLTAYDVLHWRVMGPPNARRAWAPDGGPHVQVGDHVAVEGRRYVIEGIGDISELAPAAAKQEFTCVVELRVTRVGETTA